MKQLFNSLWRHQFFTLSSGVVIAQVLSLGLMPLLTRLYPIESFGYFAIFTAASNLIGVFSTLRLEQTIPIASDNLEADNLSSMTSVMALLAGLLSALAFSFPNVRGLLPAMPQDWSLWLPIALSATLIGWVQILTQRILRNGNLKFAAIRHIFDKGSFLVISIIAARAGFTSAGLIVAQTIGNLLSVVVLAIGAAWLPRFNWRTKTELIRKYSDFPRLNTASMALQLFTTQLPTLFYSNYFAPASIGYLNLAQRLAEAPNTIVSSALATVYYRRLLIAPKDQFRRIFLRTSLWAGVVFLLPALIFTPFAAPLVTYIFGLKWETSTPYLLALLPLTCIRLNYMLQQCWLVVLRRLDIDLSISGMLLVAQTIGIVTGIYFFDDLLQPVLIASSLMAAIYVGSLFVLYKTIHGAQPA